MSAPADKRGGRVSGGMVKFHPTSAGAAGAFTFVRRNKSKQKYFFLHTCPKPKIVGHNIPNDFGFLPFTQTSLKMSTSNYPTISVLFS